MEITTPIVQKATEFVILVDENDQEIGTMEKMQAHEKGLLHRAFSLFVYNEKGEMLLQKRAIDKYHSGGLWTNACCSHPRKGETLTEAVKRRTREEMGFECEPQFAFSFIYKASLDKNLIEHELDHLFEANFSDVPVMNPAEVADFRYLSIEAIRTEIEVMPENYTEWFKIVFEKAVANRK